MDRIERSVEARQRGMIVDIVRDRHRSQQSRFDHVALYHAMQDLRADLSENRLLTYLQEMCDAGYLSCHQDVNRKTGEVSITEIVLTHLGRKLHDGLIDDPFVKF